MKLVRNRFLLRCVALFFVLEMVTSSVLPSVSWALTAGPTAPEATSFEPVDTTDMVNLLTGDLAYNIPLIEVPGPNGPYPLNMAYHAGVNPDYESSWTGLGWNYQAGSISRLVNGYPDDHKDVDVKDHFFWDGADKTTYSIGVSVPFAQGSSATAGLAFTQDSQTGFSVNGYAGASMSLLGGFRLTANSNSGGQITSPAIGIIDVITKKEINMPLHFGPASLDLSISSKGIKSRLTASGFSSEVSREGKINRINNDFSIFIPTPYGFGVQLGRSYIRQWIDETAMVKVNGSLNFPATLPNYAEMNQRAFDVYDLLLEDQGRVQKDAERELGGSFIDYDSYTVNAQGVSGSMRPYHYYEYLYRQNKNDDNKAIVRNVPLGFSTKTIGFRFENDFSNRFSFNPGAPMATESGMSMTFNENDIVAGKNGSGYKDKVLAGSKHIRHFSNATINAGGRLMESTGFIDCQANGFDRMKLTGGQDGSQIGGFQITNESGVTYHFSLPVYNLNEYSYTEKIKPDKNIRTYHEVTKSSKYAYTWMLTAITGPDYVDRGGPGNAPNHRLDDADWGYWIGFGYRKWNDAYTWRNPTTGYKDDIDHNFKTFSYGQKEVYYLDYIQTATHIAVFEKSARSDGKGVTATGDRAGGFSEASSTTAKLDKIYLLSKNDFKTLGGFSILNNEPDHQSSLTGKSIRIVKFNYDYSLCPGTLNSFEDGGDSDKKGKLTLNSIEYLGHGGQSVLPDQRFYYELESPEQGVAKLERTGADLSRYQFTNHGKLEAGDLITFSYNQATFYGLIERIDASTDVVTLRITEGTPPDLNKVRVLFKTTKNPPYNENKVDVWGLYKSDYNMETPNVRLTTALSGKSVDVWSLRGISTFTGSTIEIDYEPDYYDEVVLQADTENMSQRALRVRKVEKLSATELKVFFYDDGYDLNQAFQAGQKTDLVLVGAYKRDEMVYSSGSSRDCACPDTGPFYHQSFDSHGAAVVSDVDAAAYSITVSVENSGLMISLSGSQVTTVDYKSNCGPGGEPASCTYETKGWPTFIAFGLAFIPNQPTYGGGIRVKQIAVTNGAAQYATQYSYEHGVTSYEPTYLPATQLDETLYNLSDNINAYSKEFEEVSEILGAAALSRYANMLNIAREVPGPGVMYKAVKVQGVTGSGEARMADPNYKRYTFQTFTRDMVKYTEHVVVPTNPPTVSKHSVSDLEYTVARTKEVTLDDITQAIGSLLQASTYDQQNNLIQSTEYSYLHDAYRDRLGVNGFSDYEQTLSDQFDKQGLVNEAFSDARVVKSYSNDSYSLLGITSKRRTYPAVLVKQTERNYKTNTVSSAETTGFDFFSGMPNKTVTRDGFGGVYRQEQQAAYTQYPFMGLAMDGHENMLTQSCAETVWKLDPLQNDAVLGLVSASVQTWSDQVPALQPGQTVSAAGAQAHVWRKHASFSFIGTDSDVLPTNGLYEPRNATSFNAWNRNDPTPAEWQKNGETTLYDVTSHALEGKDLNGQYAATKLTMDQAKVTASAAPAEYREIAYSGAEESVTTDKQIAVGVYYGGGGFTTVAHTGRRAVKAAASQKAFSYVLVPKAGIYHVSVWSTQPTAVVNYTFDSNPPVAATVKNVGKAGSWYLLEADVPVTESWDRMEVSCAAGTKTAYFDDFRFHPQRASMTTYVYNAWGEVSHILDANNLYTEFRYDATGRLTATYRETLTTGPIKVSEINYHYANH